MAKKLDLTGQAFGHYTAERYSHTASGHTWWMCRCQCGALKAERTMSLRLGLVKSCGCRSPRRRQTAAIACECGALLVLGRCKPCDMLDRKEYQMRRAEELRADKPDPEPKLNLTLFRRQLNAAMRKRGISDRPEWTHQHALPKRARAVAK